MEEVKWTGEHIPTCDFCKLEVPTGVREVSNIACYDGKTTSGPWAFMCREHFNTHGVGVGTGLGQKLIFKGE